MPQAEVAGIEGRGRLPEVGVRKIVLHAGEIGTIKHIEGVCTQCKMHDQQEESSSAR